MLYFKIFRSCFLKKKYFEKILWSGFSVHYEKIVKFSVWGPKNKIIGISECFIVADFDIFQDTKTLSYLLKTLLDMFYFMAQKQIEIEKLGNFEINFLQKAWSRKS